MSIGSIIYGLGKFFSGLVSDRYSPKLIMSGGLIGAGICNIFMGFSKTNFEIGMLLVLLKVLLFVALAQLGVSIYVAFFR